MKNKMSNSFGKMRSVVLMTWVSAFIILSILTGCSAKSADKGAYPGDTDSYQQNTNSPSPASPATDPPESMPPEQSTEHLTETEDLEEVKEIKMNVQIGDTVFIATLEDNVAVQEFIEMMKEAPVSIDMSDYSGFEKVGPLGRSLTMANQQTTTFAGDIVLYSGNQIVMFYGSNSWSYTRIGKIDDLTGWEDALGSGSIKAVFTLAE